MNAGKIENYNPVNLDPVFSESGVAAANRSVHKRIKRIALGAELFLEEVFESLASIVGARRGWRGGGRYLRGLRIGSRSRVLFDGHSEFVELAVVLGVFGSDAFRDRLGALKLGAGIEEAALLATVQFELALGALAVRVETSG